MAKSKMWRHNWIFCALGSLDTINTHGNICTMFTSTIYMVLFWEFGGETSDCMSPALVKQLNGCSTNLRQSSHLDYPQKSEKSWTFRSPSSPSSKTFTKRHAVSPSWCFTSAWWHQRVKHGEAHPTCDLKSGQVAVLGFTFVHFFDGSGAQGHCALLESSRSSGIEEDG